ncbi:MAG: restriction endonuclease subunit S [Lactobacillus johnsonii]|nr:restriction endonuclease subunit S [Lactobacillus johnsonii]
MSRDYIETGVEWINSIPNNWKLLKVKNCFYISKKKAQAKNPTILKLARDAVKVRDISTNEGQIAASYDDYNPVFPGDFLLNPMDLYSGANCNVSEVEGVISPAYINLRKTRELNPKYFDYYFKVQYWTMAMFAHGKGVSFDNRWTINAEGMKNYEIPFPNIDEQNKIVAVINEKCSQIDELIAIQEQEIEKLKAYKQSLITEVVTKGLDPNAEMKNSGVDWITEIPKNWKTKPIKTLFTFSKGLSITKDNLQETGAAVISYGQIHAKWNSGITLHEELKRYVSESYFESGVTSLAHKGCFIFADTSEDLTGCGNCAYVDKDEAVFAGYHTVILRPTQNIDTKYLAYLFLTDAWRSQIRQRVYGIKLFSVTQKILKTLSVIIPDNCEPIVQFLDKKCAHIDSLVSMKEQKISFLNEYRKSLIYEYVTGKKEVANG